MITAKHQKKATPDLYVLVLTGPDSLEVELDHDGCENPDKAKSLATAIAFHLAAGSGDLGPPEVVADLIGTLNALSVDPLDCTLFVIARIVDGKTVPNGGSVVDRAPVATCAASPAFAVMADGWR